MTLWEWLKRGVDEGWISEPVCITHNGVPSTPDELEEWEDGGDPCQVCVRVWPA